MFWGTNASPLGLTSLDPDAAALAEANVVVTIVAILLIWNKSFMMIGISFECDEDIIFSHHDLKE